MKYIAFDFISFLYVSDCIIVYLKSFSLFIHLHTPYCLSYSHYGAYMYDIFRSLTVIPNSNIGFESVYLTTTAKLLELLPSFSRILKKVLKTIVILFSRVERKRDADNFTLVSE